MRVQVGLSLRTAVLDVILGRAVGEILGVTPDVPNRAQVRLLVDELHVGDVERLESGVGRSLTLFDDSAAGITGTVRIVIQTDVVVTVCHDSVSHFPRANVQSSTEASC